MFKFIKPIITITLGAVLATAAYATTKSTSTPTLSHNDQLAAKSVVADMNTVVNEVNQFQEEIKGHYPGYHFNFEKGGLEKDPEPSKAPKPPTAPDEIKPATESLTGSTTKK